MELKFFLLPRVIVVLMLMYYPKGTVLSSPRVVSICPGEQLTLTCITNQNSILRWTIILHGENITYSRSIPFMGNSILLPITDEASAVTFNFMRTSESGTLPLIAELLIDTVNTNTNGTRIHCSPSNESDPQVTFIIHVLEASSVLRPLEVKQNVTNFGAANFTVVLNWIQENDHMSYNVSIDPSTELVPVMNNSWQVTGSYNTLYNVSVVATLCETNSTTTISLEYATCESLAEESLGGFDPMLRISNTGSRNPAIHVEGDNVTFYCISGELVGQKRTTCLSSGNWEPDPREVTCKQVSLNPRCHPLSRPINGYILINTSTSVTFVCQNQTQPHLEISFTATCDILNGVWEPNPSDRCTSTESRGTNGALVGGVLGTLLIVAILVLAVVVIVVILIKKGSISSKKLRRLVLNQNSVSDHPQVESQNSIDPAETLVYADVGPSSLRKNPYIIPNPDDDQIEYAQLNHNLHTVKLDEPKQKTEASSVDATLNLDTLLIQIQVDVTSRWYQLGEALGIDKEVLDRYSRRPPEESIVEMLDQWLRSSPPEKPTWRDVATALKKIGLQQLALDIEKVYETGKLPIDVIVNDIPKDAFPSLATRHPPPLPSKMKQNISDSNLISHRQRTLPSKTKQTSDSHLINHHHHGIHKQPWETLPLQEIAPQPVVDAPPLPPKPIAASDTSINVPVPSRPPKNLQM